ncbi:hypothetical protein [Metabacillus fastidiosus]|uniref:hypothetical protein n=1 Tax=Metabacillus fastidiosus TaxID=1458 RepID=UPI003D2D0CA8
MQVKHLLFKNSSEKAGDKFGAAKADRMGHKNGTQTYNGIRNILKFSGMIIKLNGEHGEIYPELFN